MLEVEDPKETGGEHAPSGLIEGDRRTDGS